MAPLKMLPVFSLLAGSLSAAPLAAEEMLNGDFESLGGWLVDCVQTPAPPSYAPGLGREGTRGFRLGPESLGGVRGGGENGAYHHPAHSVNPGHRRRGLSVYLAETDLLDG